MNSFNLKTCFVAILIATPMLSQATLKFPEPVEIEASCDCNWIRTLIRNDADFWMILYPSFRNPAGVYVTKEIRSGTAPGEIVRYLAHFTEAKVAPPKIGQEKGSEPTHLTAELPTDVVGSLDAAWKAILRQTRYQDPPVKNGVISVMVDGESFYFGYRHRYFGMNRSLVTDEAWLIQNLGMELMKYVKSLPQDRLASIERIHRLLTQVDHLTTPSAAQ